MIFDSSDGFDFDLSTLNFECDQVICRLYLCMFFPSFRVLDEFKLPFFASNINLDSK